MGCSTASGKCTEFTNTCPWPSYLYLGKAWLTRATQLMHIKDENPGLPDFQTKFPSSIPSTTFLKIVFRVPQWENFFRGLRESLFKRKGKKYLDVDNSFSKSFHCKSMKDCLSSDNKFALPKLVSHLSSILHCTAM